MECTDGRKWLQTPPLGKVFDSSIPKNTTTFSQPLQRRLALLFLVPVERIGNPGILPYQSDREMVANVVYGLLCSYVQLRSN